MSLTIAIMTCDKKTKNKNQNKRKQKQRKTTIIYLCIYGLDTG